MGCILFSLELLFESIIEGWFFLMEWIVPEHYISHTARIVLKIVIRIFSTLLFLMMFLGVFAIISDDEYTNKFGRYMFFIPLCISAVQIFFGIIVRIISKKKNK